LLILTRGVPFPGSGNRGSGPTTLFETRRQLRHVLPRLPQLAQQVALSGFRVLGARQGLSRDRLVARGLRAQLAVGPGLALELLAHRAQLGAQRLDFAGPRSEGLRGRSVFEL
jgi:hypothetical protein